MAEDNNIKKTEIKDEKGQKAAVKGANEVNGEKSAGKSENDGVKKSEAAEKTPAFAAETKKETDDLLKPQKNALGLEELPEDIQKKLDKKKSERDQKGGKKGGRKKKKKAPRRVSVGKAFIASSYNNTIVTLTDLNGNVLAWASAGIAGFRGPKKSTPYAAQIITRIAVAKAREEYGLSEVEVFVRGVGTGRESAVRALNANGLIVTAIKDITPVPHNGCRPKKPRRV